MVGERNWAVWVLVIMAVIAGIVNVLDAARYMGWLPIAVLGDLRFVLPSANWLGALLSALVALIWFSVASQLYNLNPAGWRFVVIIAIFNLILLGLAILGRSTFTSVSLGLLVNVVALILAFLPNTKAAYGQP